MARVQMPAAVARALAAHAGAVRTLSFSASGMLASGSDDALIGLYEINRGVAPVAMLEGHQSWVLGTAFAPDGSCNTLMFLSSGIAGSKYLWV